MSAEPLVIAGRFEVRRRLGAGGFGVVYEVLDREQQAVVALKTMLRSDGDSLFRLKREFRSLADIAHPNLITLYELLSDERQCFFTMELIEGVDFLSWVAGREAPLPTSESDNAATQTMLAPYETSAATSPPEFRPDLERLRSALRQLAVAVTALHRAGQLHLDLKPSNVLVSASGRVVVLDFGISSSKSATLADGHRGAGTPGYMSPEQASGKSLTEASDWYSVGVMLFQALTGKRPFDGPVQQMLANKMRDDPPAPSALAPCVPADLEALCLALLRRDPQERPSGDTLLRQCGVDLDSIPPATVAPETLFVGRAGQLEILHRALDSVHQGHAAQVVVHGPAGAGKTAFVQHFLASLRGREDCLVLAGRCYEQEFGRYQALDSVIDALSKYLAALPWQQRLQLLPRDAFLLSRLFPVLKSIGGIAVAQPHPPDERELRRRAFACMRTLLANLAAQRAVVIFIDDVHWSDPDSAPLLAELQREPDAPAILWITCRRNPDIAPREIGIALQELNADESRELAAAILPYSPTRAEAVARESAGNPLFLCELARRSAAAPHAVHMEQMIEQRIAELPAGARRTLEIAAVARRPVPRAIARNAAELGAEESPVLAQLRVARLLRTRSAEGLPEIEIYHDRIRSAVLAGVAPEALRERHTRLAMALEQSGRADPETLMFHFQGARDTAKTIQYAIAAGERSTAALAFHSAAGFYRAALETGIAEPARANQVRVRLADALASAGRGFEAAEIYQAAAAEESGAQARVELLRRAAAQYLASGHPVLGMELLRRVLRGARLAAPSSTGRAVFRVAGRRLRFALGGYRWRERAESEIAPWELLRIDACWSAAQGLAMTDLIQAAAFHGLHLTLALKAGEPYRVARALCVEAGLFAIAGRSGEKKCAALLERASAIAGRIANPHAIGLSLLVSGMSAFLSGRWKLARDRMELAETALREHCAGVAWELATARLMHSVSLFFLGEVRTLSAHLPALLASAEARGDIYEATDLRIRISHAMLLALDRPEEALREVERAAQSWPRDRFYMQHWWSLIASTEIHLYRGDAEAAWNVVNGAWASLRSSLILGVQYIRVESLYHRACAALALGHERALRQAAKDAARLSRERAPWAVPLAMSVKAGLAAARGNTAQAADWLARAESGFAAADMSLFAAAARWHRDRGAAEDMMLDQDIHDPSRMARMLIPVFARLKEDSNA
jgi:eukaryotic-like serine/threonine-protein kinase